MFKKKTADMYKDNDIKKLPLFEKTTAFEKHVKGDFFHEERFPKVKLKSAYKDLKKEDV